MLAVGVHALALGMVVAVMDSVVAGGTQLAASNPVAVTSLAMPLGTQRPFLFVPAHAGWPRHGRLS